jgi:hypothetical protein
MTMTTAAWVARFRYAGLTDQQVHWLAFTRWRYHTGRLAEGPSGEPLPDLSLTTTPEEAHSAHAWLGRLRRGAVNG